MLDSVIQLNEVDSTNNYLRRMIEQSKDALPQGFSVYSKYQTAGRGQIGNAWISERGKNLLASILIYPKHIAIHDQFYISKAVSVAVIDALKSLFIEHSSSFYIKWPNDIYFENRKLAGILVENFVMEGMISNSIIGLGINVNQEHFPDSLPNPISLVNITKKETSVEDLLSDIRLRICTEMEKLKFSANRETLSFLYLNALYKRNMISNFSNHEIMKLNY